MLRLKQNEHIVTIIDELSAVDLQQDQSLYQIEYTLGDAQYAPSCAHGVKYGEPEVLHSCLVSAADGATGVHAASAILHNGKCILAISSFLACLQLPDLDLLWHTQVDMATCFGVYHLLRYESYLSHGELEIARVSYDGKIIWSSGGKDIFTNGFALHDEYVEVVDFNNEKYRIDLLTGNSTLLEP